ncbi:MAG TPA: hypothetical protein VFB76_20235 [Candidatus Angelobacter sp.]|nr:hypothetical protein [Candidatus Angelobacter sp.]
MKKVFVVLAGIALVYFGWAALNPQKVIAANPPAGTFLITITDSHGAFASNSVITLHNDSSVAVIDSGQEGNGVPFSSQQGVWAIGPGGTLKARTIDWSFPFATNGSARVDYTFNAGGGNNQVSGTIVLTFFPPNGNPLDGGGSPGGTFTFTGQRVTIP